MNTLHATQSGTPSKASQESKLLRAHVLGHVEGAYTINLDQSTTRACVAASCLLQPEQGDLVLVACHKDGHNDYQSHILAVLEKTSQQGNVHVPKNTTLSAKGELRLEADTLTTRSRYMERSAACVVDRFGRIYRYVEGLEQACLGRFRQLVTGSVFTKGKTVTCNADKTVNIDADEINLG